MNTIQMTTDQLQGLINSEIVALKGISGKVLDGDDAATKAQTLGGIVRMHAMSGATFEMSYHGNSDTFTMEVC